MPNNPTLDQILEEATGSIDSYDRRHEFKAQIVEAIQHCMLVDPPTGVDPTCYKLLVEKQSKAFAAFLESSNDHLER